MNTAVDLTDFLWPEHRRRCDEVIRNHQAGAISSETAADKLERLGYSEREIRDELSWRVA
jgi:hypothetical protein